MLKVAGKRRFTYVRSVLNFLLQSSYELLLAFWFLSALIFAAIYWLLSYYDPTNAPTLLPSIEEPLHRFFEALYFSIITATSTGYGDIVPLGFSKGFAALQSVGSVVVMALFVAKFAAVRQEVLLEDVHELSFDSAFHSIRQGLFIARKDLDRVIEKIQEGTTMSPKDWRNVYISLHQVQIFIRQIPTMYNTNHREFELGIDRERLLLDAVERTLRRVAESFLVFEEAGVSYAGHEGSVKELKELATLSVRLFEPQRKKTMDPENREAFDDVIATAKEIKELAQNLHGTKSA